MEDLIAYSNIHSTILEAIGKLENQKDVITRDVKFRTRYRYILNELNILNQEIVDKGSKLS